MNTVLCSFKGEHFQRVHGLVITYLLQGLGPRFPHGCWFFIVFTIITPL